MEIFDPGRLTPNASLNRMPIVDVTGMLLEEDMRGKTAYELLSKEALIAEILQHASTLRLDPRDPESLPYRLGSCFFANDEESLRAAHSIAGRWGQRLATLALILKRSGDKQRAARPEWDASYWEHWASVKHIWFGGGLMAGPFGQEVIQVAQAHVVGAGVDDLSLELAPHPRHLPLLGAARSVPFAAPEALVFDFGSTAVKRAVPVFVGQRLTALRPLPPLPVVLPSIDARAQSSLTAARRFIAETIRATIDVVGPQALQLHIVASISAYVAENRIIPGQGGRYRELTDSIDTTPLWFAEYLKQHTGLSVVIDFVHDGTAAARTFAGTQHAAVIMVGTALGSGFPPTTETLRPIASTVSVVPFLPEA